MSGKAPAVPARTAAYIAAHGLLVPGQRVVVGVSGGVDSVVLLRTLQALGYDVIAAHFDHRLRPDSSADAAFVRGLGERLGVPVEVGVAEEVPTVNVEAWARAARYAFLHETADRHGAYAVAVGHHRDDQLETVLLNLLRGSGLRGLAGMRPARPLRPGSGIRLIRPLLGLPRADLVAHAEEQRWVWREDPTNADPSFRRNALRHRVVPALREVVGSSVDTNVARTADLVAAYLDALASGTGPLPDLDAFDETHVLPLDVLGALPTVLRDDLVGQALARWLPDAPRSQATIEAVGALTHAQVGQFVPLGPSGPQGQATVWREHKALRFFEHDPRATWDAIDLTHPGAYVEKKEPTGGTLSAALLDAVPPVEALRGEAPWTVTLDADAAPFPLTLRPWAPGERLQPLGMDGRQAVSDLLTNAKVPSAFRASWPVVEGGGRILWVVGVRIAEHARVTPQTERALRLRWTPAGH